MASLDELWEQAYQIHTKGVLEVRGLLTKMEELKNERDLLAEKLRQSDRANQQRHKEIYQLEKHIRQLENQKETTA